MFDVIRMRLGFGDGPGRARRQHARQPAHRRRRARRPRDRSSRCSSTPPSASSSFVAAIALVAIVALLPFGGIERIFGYGGLLLLVFVATAIHQQPDWGGGRATASSPRCSGSTALPLLRRRRLRRGADALRGPLLLVGGDRGGLDRGEPEGEPAQRDRRLRARRRPRLALVVVSGYLFHPLGVDPGDLGTVALPAQGAFGETGLLLALGGMLFCVGGAAIDSSFAASYNLAQFLGWEWGRYRGPKSAPRFTVSWLVFLFLGVADRR